MPAPSPNKKGSSLAQGLLTGVRPTEVAARGINIYDPKLTPEALWGPDPPQGGAFLDLVLDFYSEGEHDIPFFFYLNNSSGGDGGGDADGNGGGLQRMRAIVKSPLSRALQQSTVESYKQRIFKESISQVAAGSQVSV